MEYPHFRSYMRLQVSYEGKNEAIATTVRFTHVLSKMGVISRWAYPRDRLLYIGISLFLRRMLSILIAFFQRAQADPCPSSEMIGCCL